MWAHASHPNILPLYGAFYESGNEIPQLCLVSPYMKNGVLRDYAPRLLQEGRVPLVCCGSFLLCFFKMMNCFQITDVVNALVYLNGLDVTVDDITGVCMAHVPTL
jgi:serine/threonine protein kinase